MAGGQERVLRRRIRSVQATKKITKAMELIAASQIVRAQQRIAANRRYREGMARIVVAAAKGDPDRRPQAARHARVAAAGGDPRDRRRPRPVRRLQHLGVPGQRAARDASCGATAPRCRMCTVGKKAPAYFRFRGIPVEQSFAGFADKPTFAERTDGRGRRSRRRSSPVSSTS